MSTNPRRPADVRIRAGDGTPLPELTEAMLGDLLEKPPDPDCLILELSRADLHDIRARLLSDGVYELEYRAGSANESFQMYTSDAVLVRDVLRAWLSDDPWWHDAVAWYRVDPAIAELQAVQEELAGMLDGLTVLDDVTASMDAALARADELMAMDFPEPNPADSPDQD
ncbi:hypothetical protein OH799_02250 [Nocardia sp. NBC_00881]|uniref:hypothetical protein n=1 Tax=Nocardia sp. NBC_00881 TaxID=2975995 RepID=UPI00386EF73B|nr:hypothetical protein OH799_02250 [Nocardia sp. NBC_00881]